jgi:hypothetical protein
MTVRLGVDLEPLAELTRLWSDAPLDILDFAYAAGAAGTQMLLAPEAKFDRAEVALLARVGLPLFVLKVRQSEFARAGQVPRPADRIFVVADHDGTLKEIDDFESLSPQASDSADIGVFVESEPGPVKKAARAGLHWVVFSTTPYAHASTMKEAEDELARLSAAVFAAQKLDLRVAVMGAIFPHLLGPLAKIEGIEEIYAGSEIWLRALRVGWDRAVAEYRDAMRQP